MKRIFRSNIFVNILLLMTTSLLGLFLLEVGMRLVEKVKGIKLEFRVFQDTVCCPCVLMPNLRLETNVGGEQVLISTNSVGMHWREAVIHKPANIQRIAFVGDSFTFGEWANRVENSFVGIVDSHTKSRGFEILNFGVPSDGLAEIELRLQKSILAYSPDYIVVMFYNGNDMSDTYLGAGKTDCASGRLRREVVEEKIPAEFRESSWQAAKTFLDGHSALVRALRFVKGRLLADPRFTDPSDSAIALSPFKIDNRFLTPSFWSRTEYPPAAEQARDTTLQVLEKIRRLSQEHGAQLLIITIPFREQVYALQEAGDGYDIALPQKYIEQFAKRKNILYYDLLPPLRSYVMACQEIIYVPDDPHFNTRGHYIVGELISGFLARTFEVLPRK